MYEFDDKRIQGDEGVKRFVCYLERKYPQLTVKYATPSQDRQGTDLICTNQHGETFRVQVKTDFQAQHTGNLFLETISNERRGTHGLIYKGGCDWVVFVVAGKWTAYMLTFKELEEAFNTYWKGLYRRPVFNTDPKTGEEWTTLGIVVTIQEFIHYCDPRVHPFNPETPSV